MNTFLYSYIKPLHQLDSVNEWNCPANKFSEQIFNLNKAYTETYPNVQPLLACYSYNEQFQKIDVASNWILLLSFALLCFLTFIKVQFPAIFKQLLISLFNFQYARQLVNEKSGVVQKASFFLLTLYLLAFSFIIYMITIYYRIQISSSPWGQMIIILVLSFLFYFVKFALYKWTAFLNEQHEKTNLVLSHYSVFYRNLAIFLTPIAAAMPFIHYHFFPFFLYTTLFILISFSLFRLYRAFLLSVQFNVSLLHIFLYLCTVEIVPLIYGIKLLNMWVQ